MLVRSLSLLACLALLLAPTLAVAETGWVTDARTGCRLWLPRAEPGFALSWTGGCKGKLAEGLGAFELKLKTVAGAKGEGEFKAGRREGTGYVLMPDGERYEGNYAEGRRQGRGVLTRPDGYRYEGEFRAGKPNGHGTATQNGDRYEGEWADGEFAGRGVYTYANGGRYEGEFRAGKPHGQGTYTGPATGGGTATWKGAWIDGCHLKGSVTAAVLTTRKACGF